MSNYNAQQEKLGFALVSSNRNRIFFYHKNYEVTKRLQLHFLRNDLLYLVPVTLKMLHRQRLLDKKKQQNGNRIDKEFDFYSCINYTFNNAKVLQVELDVAPFRQHKMHLIQTPTDATDEDNNIHQNLMSASKYIESFKTALDQREARLDEQFSYTIKGYEMFQEFCQEQFTNSQLSNMFEIDIADEKRYKLQMRELRIKITDAIMEMNFTVEPGIYNTLFNEKIKELTGKANEYERTVLKAAEL